MDATTALIEIQKCVARGRVLVGDHARDRMEERGIAYRDIIHALRGATACTAGEHGRWKVSGTDLDDMRVTVIAELAVDIKSLVIVVTVF